jgi:hypothetical protein
VGAPAGCGWTVVSHASWITVTSAESGTGNGQVVFSVSSNQAGAAPRTGTLTVPGWTFTATQAAGAPSP